MTQYGRQYQIKLFAKNKSVIFSTSNNLQIEFDIKLDLSGTSNQADISIYGLAETTRNSLRESLNRVLLSAGYPQNTDVIFDGQTTKVSVDTQGADVKTRLTGADGIAGLKYGSISIFSAADTPITDVITRIAGGMPGVSVGILSGLEGKKLAADVAFSGLSRLLLDALGRMYDFSWSIQTALLETVAGKATTKGATIGDAGKSAYVISSKTGMVGRPSVKDDGKISVTALLNPRIRPGRVVKIETSVTGGSGFYKVEKVNFRGSYRGNDWYIMIDGVPL